MKRMLLVFLPRNASAILCDLKDGTSWRSWPRGLLKQDSFVLTRLMVGDQAVAWNYGFQFERSLFWYQPTFDSRVEEHSPGYCLLSQMIIEACDEPALDVVDLGLGAEGYKERFANASRETRHLTLTTSRRRYIGAATRFKAAEAIKGVSRSREAGSGHCFAWLVITKADAYGQSAGFHTLEYETLERTRLEPPAGGILRMG